MSETKLPIGIHDFESIISEGYTYVDKTEMIYRLITRGKPYFLPRPRRFGKSLLTSTLLAIFSGRQDLFKDLYIGSSDWNWVTYPVIQLDLAATNNRTSEMLERSLIRTLVEIATNYNLTITGETSSDYLRNLIRQLFSNQGQKVVVLIDEYDKPLLDRLNDPESAKANREILKDFFTVLKSEDHYLKFIFLTGVTKFTKVSVFSGLNNLIDLSMHDQYSTLLGYTRDELEKYFSGEIEELAGSKGLSSEKCYDLIREWYNGYQFSRAENKVYNPFSVLNLFNSKQFTTHWFETGTPEFLIDLIEKRQFDISNFDEIDVTEQSFSTFDIEEIPTLPLLYQTGYLTIKSVLPEVNAFSLGFPNREVSQAFSESLLTAFATSKSECNKFLIDLSKNLRTTPWNYSSFFEIMQSILALIPYDLYIKYERHYHSLCYLILKLAGFQIDAEVHTQNGKVDISVETNDKIILFEFKLNQSSSIAIDQVKKKKYYQFYQDRKLLIYIVGVNFNGKERTIDSWKVEQI